MWEDAQTDQSEYSSKQTRLDWFPDPTGPPTILIVEDEPLIGLELATIICERGGTVVGPVGCVEDAKAALASVHIDGAIVDLNLNGELNYEVAAMLQVARVPFVIHTGVDSNLVPRRQRSVPCLHKPGTGIDVVDRLIAVMDEGS